MTSEAAPPKEAADASSALAQGSGPFAKLFKPYLYITAYYGLFAVIIGALLIANPRLIEFAPVGGAVQLGSGLEGRAFEPVDLTAPGRTALAEGVKLALSIVGAFALMLPVTWVCMGARRRKDVSQSFVQTILVLPMIIAGIVHVVHNSLALAFSLAGIVAGVRFRHTLKDSAETTYLFTSIGVGVACGINAVEVAAIISIFFNYTVLGLWATEFGSATTGKQMFSREWMANEPERERPKKDKNRDRNADDDDDD